jgi:hypothetical protein
MHSSRSIVALGVYVSCIDYLAPEVMCEKVGIHLLFIYFYMHLSCFGRQNLSFSVYLIHSSFKCACVFSGFA